MERLLALRFRLGAFPGVARLDGNVPAWLVFTFQAASEGIFPFHPIATVKHQNITLVKNIFLKFFPQSVDSHIDSVFLHSERSRYLPVAEPFDLHEDNSKGKLVHFGKHCIKLRAFYLV